MKHISSSETGRSLVEMLGVLAIIGVLTVGAMSGVTFGLTAFRAQTVYDLVETTATNVNDIFSWARNFPDSQDGIRNRVCPKGNVFDNGCTGGHTGIQTIFPDSFIDVIADDGYYRIRVTNIPKEACERLADMAWVNVQPAAGNSCSNDKNTLLFDP